MPEVTCRQFIDFLDDYIAGEQPEPVRREFEQHVSVCPQCVDYLRSYREAVKLGKAVFRDCPEAKVPSCVPEDLVKAVMKMTVGRGQQR